MESAATSAAEPAFHVEAEGGAPATVAEVQASFKDWLEAFTGEALTGDDSVIENVSGIIATAEAEALDLLGERLHDLLGDLVAAAEETGEDISADYFAAVEGVLAAIDLRLAPFDAEPETE